MRGCRAELPQTLLWKLPGNYLGDSSHVARMRSHRPRGLLRGRQPVCFVICGVDCGAYCQVICEPSCQLWCKLWRGLSPASCGALPANCPDTSRTLPGNCPEVARMLRRMPRRMLRGHCAATDWLRSRLRTDCGLVMDWTRLRTACRTFAGIGSDIARLLPGR